MMKLQPHTPNKPALHPLFAASPELLADNAGALRKKTYDNHDRIISHGDVAQQLWLVQSGWVKLTRQTPDGKESIVGLCTEGDVFGEATLFPGSNYPYNAEVIGNEAELVAIPATTIRNMIDENKQLAAQIMALLNDRILESQLKLEQMSTMSAAQRIGCFLLRLCHAERGGSKTIHIPVEKNVLATYLGMKAETFSRSQAHLKALNIEIIGQQISIGSINKLREFVCSSCSKSGNCNVEADAF
jgi:CRP-like cAMP-binding protein